MSDMDPDVMWGVVKESLSLQQELLKQIGKDIGHLCKRVSDLEIHVGTGFAIDQDVRTTARANKKGMIVERVA